MGRYLAVGIPARICIYERKKVPKNKEKELIKGLKQYINLDFYDYDKEDNVYILKKKMFENNIHQTLKDFYNKLHIIPDDLFAFKREIVPDLIQDPNFNLENYKFKLDYNENCISLGKDIEVNICIGYIEEFWLTIETKIHDFYQIKIDFIPISSDSWKCLFEDNFYTLRCLNNLKRYCFNDQNSLLSTMLFYIMY